MPMRNTTDPRRKRADAGVVNNKPIGLRLKPEELQRVKEIADLEQRTMAAVCRLALLRGLANYEPSKVSS